MSFVCFPIRWADNAHRLGYAEFWQAFLLLGGLITAMWFATFHAPFLVPTFFIVMAAILTDFRGYLRASEYSHIDDFDQDAECCCGGEPCCTGSAMDFLNYVFCPFFTVLQESRHTEFLLRKNEKLRSLMAADANFRVKKQPIAAPGA